MSLINEALRKARLEAARQDAAQRGLGYPGVQARRRGKRVVLAAAGGLAVTILGATLFWLGMRAAQSPTGPQTVAGGAAETAAATKTSASATPNAQALGSEAPVVHSAPPPSSGSETPAGRETATIAQAPGGETKPRIAPGRTNPPAEGGRQPPAVVDSRIREPASLPAAEPVTPFVATAEEPVADRRPVPTEPKSEPEPEPEAVAAGSEDPAIADPEPTAGSGRGETTPSAASTTETFVREASIPGVGNLRLGGIAWSERQPYALINGRVVGPGDRVQGLQVSAVERTQVKLRDTGGVTYVLRIR